MPKDEQPGISEETAAMLDDHVKKGKARKFFLIYKGASIKTLVVFKKGPFGPKIMKAKKDGFKGEVVTGIITGKGKNLLFQLPGNPDVADAMKAEGSCEKEPTKKAKLKEFLANNGLKRKPEYEIITDVGAVLDPESDEEAVVPGLEAMEAEDTDADESASTEEAPSAADAELGKKLAEAVKKVKPLMVAAIKADPTKKEEIQSTIVKISGQIKAKQYDQAKVDIKMFVDTLKALTTAAPQPSAREAAPAGPSPEEARKKLAETLKKVAPAFKAAVAADIDEEMRNSLTSLMGQLKEHVSASDLAAAKVTLGELVPLIKQASAAPAAAEPEAAVETPVAAEAPASAAASINPLAVWQEAKDDVDQQFEKLTTALRQSPHPYLQKVAELGLHGLAEDTGGVFVGMMRSLFEFRGASGDGKAKAAQQILTAVGNYREFINGNQVLPILETYQSLTIRATLLKALGELETEMNRLVA